MVKEIIFDCFGVLTQDGWTTFLKKFSNDENREELRYLNKSVDSGQISMDEFFDEICKVSDATKAEAVSILVTSYHPEEDVFALIKRLKANYKIGLISNVSSPIVDYLPANLLDLFDEQTLSYQAGVIKPNREIFDIHLRKTGTKPEEAVFIDDREVNVDGARAAGLQAIWYKYFDQLESELEALGVQV